MKIAQIISALNYGGAERQLLWLCQGLKKRNHDVVVAVMKSSGPMKQDFEKHGITVREIGMSGSVDPLAYFKLAKWIKSEKPDIVHTHLFKADVYGTFAAHRLGIPVISSKRNEDQYLKNAWIARIARSVAKRCKRTLAISRAVQQFLMEIAAFEESWIEIVRIGVPIDPVQNHTQQEPPRFGIVARLEKQKGHAFLFHSIAAIKEKIPSFQMLVFGAGSLEEPLKTLACSLGI